MMQIRRPDNSQSSAIIYFLKNFKILYSLIFVVTILSSVMETLSVLAFFPIFSSLVSDSPTENNGILGFIDYLVEFLNFGDPIVSATVLLFLIILLKTLLVLTREYLTTYTSAKVLYSIKRQVMTQYAGAEYQFHLDQRHGTSLYNMLAAPSSVSNLLLTGSRMLAALIKLVSIIIALIFVFPLAAGALILLGIAYYVIIHWLSKKLSYRFSQGRAQAGIEETVVATEFLTGFRQILTFGVINHWAQKFDRQNKTFSELFAKDQAWAATPRPVIEFAAMGLLLGFVLVVWTTNQSNLAGSLPLLGIFAVALVQILPALSSIGSHRMAIMSSLPNAELIFETLVGGLPTRSDGNLNLTTFEDSITFAGVSFAHKDRDSLLQRASFSFKKGEVTALVGPSGAGKTTIINLILGLFKPNEGEITINGVPLNNIKHDTWISKIGFVSQEPFTYHSTIFENIQFGRERSTMEDVIRAATIANAHEFISELPLGYETIVGDRGMKISGGQQQRLAIARAVLNNPDILIFDEATSSLDTISEKAVQAAIDNVSTDRTVIIIAHRLSTIRHATNIIVLENGNVVEQGNHHELLSKDGHYSKLVASSN